VYPARGVHGRIPPTRRVETCPQQRWRRIRRVGARGRGRPGRRRRALSRSGPERHACPPAACLPRLCPRAL